MLLLHKIPSQSVLHYLLLTKVLLQLQLSTTTTPISKQSSKWRYVTITVVLWKECPWAQHLTILPKRAVDVLSSISAFNHKRVSMSRLQRLNALKANNWTNNSIQQSCQQLQSQVGALLRVAFFHETMIHIMSRLVLVWKVCKQSCYFCWKYVHGWRSWIHFWVIVLPTHCTCNIPAHKAIDMHAVTQ